MIIRFPVHDGSGVQDTFLRETNQKTQAFQPKKLCQVPVFARGFSKCSIGDFSKCSIGELSKCSIGNFQCVCGCAPYTPPPALSSGRRGLLARAKDLKFRGNLPAACLFGSSTSVTDPLWLLIQKVPPLPSAFFEMGEPEPQPEAVEEKLKRLTDLSHEWNEV